jgi:hypothetical protein
MDREDYTYLKDCIFKRWEESHDTVMTVGRILKEEGYIRDVDQAFDYFDAPWHYETDMKEIMSEWEMEHLSGDFFRLSVGKEREIALQWISEFMNCEKKTFKYFLDYIDDESTYGGV